MNIFKTIAKSTWNKNRLHREYIDQLHDTPFLHSSDHLTQLIYQSETQEDLDAILDHMDRHNTYGIPSYSAVRGQAYARGRKLK